MNVENIRRVADAIEQHEIADLGFNMGDYISKTWKDRSGHHCKTTACIAGWTYILQGGKRKWDCKAYFSAKQFLGIDENIAFTLFTPPLARGWSSITPQEAVRTLRHLAATGEVNWDLPDPA